MKKHIKAFCLILAVLTICCITGCKKNNDDTDAKDNPSELASTINSSNTSDSESNVSVDIDSDVPTDEINSLAGELAGTIFGKDSAISSSFDSIDTVNSISCFIYTVKNGLNEIGNIAIDKANKDNIFVKSSAISYISYKSSTADLPESEVRNSNGDQMILNVVDSSVCVYSISGELASLIQIIDVDVESGETLTNDKISAANFNFDDHTDISVMKNGDASTTTLYCDYYIYNSSTDRFVKNDKLSKIPNIGVDGGENTLSSFIHISATDNFTTTYTWKGDDIVAVKKVAQAYDEDSKLFYISEYEFDADGNEILVSNESYTLDELEELQS